MKAAGWRSLVYSCLVGAVFWTLVVSLLLAE